MKFFSQSSPSAKLRLSWAHAVDSKISSYAHPYRSSLLAVACLVAIKSILLFLVFPHFLKLVPDTYAQLYPDQYNLIADTLSKGRGYRFSPDTAPTMARPPGFILPLAAIFYFFGTSIIPVQILNLLMSIATFAFVFLISMQIFNSKPISWVAAAFCFLMPNTLIADSRGGIESLQMMLISATFYFANNSKESEKYLRYVVIGLLFGYLILVKASVALTLPAFWLCRIVSCASRSELFWYLRRYILAGVMVVLVSMPWVVRNYLISDQFVPFMSVSGMSIDQGVYIVKHYSIWKSTRRLMLDAADAEFKIANQMGIKLKDDDYYPKFYEVRDELKFYKILQVHGLNQYYDDPTLIVRAMGVNLFQFWFSGRDTLATLFNIIITVPVLILYIMGLWIASRRKAPYVAFPVALVAYIAPHLLIVAMARYYVVILPLLAPFVGATLFAIGQRLSGAILGANDLGQPLMRSGQN